MHTEREFFKHLGRFENLITAYIKQALGQQCLPVV